uniref:Putative secreted protein n=1 Tax=Ixodes ricinus TaxID=34613 RepID=A0A6B0TW38_IXORI
MVKTAKVASARRCRFTYFAILAASRGTSAKSCTMSTRLPMRWRLHAQEKDSSRMVRMWCTNICQKSLRLVSMNWDMVRDM